MALILSQLVGAILDFVRGSNIPLVCTKCNAEGGTIFCDRSLLGEEGACDFRPKRPQLIK